MPIKFENKNISSLYVGDIKIAKVYKGNALVWQKSGDFSDEYQRVEYIKSTGTQYIDTGIKINSQYRYITKFNTTAQSSLRYIFMNNSSPFLGIAVPASSSLNRLYYNKTSNINLNINLNDIEIELSRTLKRTDTDETLYTGSADFTSNETMLLFGTKTENRRSVSKIYYFKIYDNNNNLICDLVPCYRKSDGEIGMYDLVSDVFRTNLGTGTFLKGDEIIELPEEYQRLTYIESTGTQYIDTKLLYAVNDRIEVEIAPVVITQDRVVFGSYMSSAFVELGILTSKFRCDISNTATTPIVENVKYKAIKDGKTWTVDGNTITTDGSNKDTTYPIYLFGRCFNGAAQKLSNIKVYSYKHIRSNITIANLIPCYRKSDNTVGMYDLITNTFLTNSGTGTFVKGIEVAKLPTDYQQVEYIESTGTQWINTQYRLWATSNWRFEFKFSVTELYEEKSSILLGVQTGATHKMFVTSTSSLNMIMPTFGSRTISTIQTDTPYILKCNNMSSNFEAYLDGALKNRLNRSATANNTNMSIFHDANKAYSNLKGKIYYTKFWAGENDVIVRDFVPCYRKSDDEIGLYDLVNNVFYTNSGTDTFIKGEDIK